MLRSYWPLTLNHLVQTKWQIARASITHTATLENLRRYQFGKETVPFLNVPPAAELQQLS
jgi:hypothetical protein